MIKTVMALVDKLLPGQKTYITMAVATGMIVCQGLGHAQFSPEQWGVVGVMGATFMKMGLDRK